MEEFKKKQRLLGGQGGSRGAAPNLVRIKASQGEGFVQNCSLPLGVRPSPCRVQLMPAWADLCQQPSLRVCGHVEQEAERADSGGVQGSDGGGRDCSSCPQA